MKNLFSFYILLCCIGIIAAGFLPVLPSPSVCVFLIPLVFLIKRFPLLKMLLAICMGVAYGVFSGYCILNSQLNTELVKQDIWVVGTVVDLPQADSRRQLFSFAVINASLDAENSQPITHFPKKINLSSYDSLRVKTGEQWRLLVTLKKPRGFVNPGGFDYQVSLLRRGVGATGHIRTSAGNQRLQSQPLFAMDVLRYQLQQWLLQKSESPEKGILIALLVGDTSQVDKQHWGEMIKTGTNHLIAISGLHLGFFAIVGFFLGNFMGRCAQLIWRQCPSMYIGYFFAMSFTLFYSIVAGLNIPTMRTLIMLGVVQCVMVLRRNFRGRDMLLLALLLVLLYDPLAAFDIGFWLSFGAVAILMFCFSGRIKSKKEITLNDSAHVSSFKSLFLSRLESMFSAFKEFIQSQWVMFVGLLIPLAILVHSISFLAPLANFIAIPLVTFFVVPCLILAAIFHFMSVRIFELDIAACAENLFLKGAETGLALLHQWLQYLLAFGEGKLNPLVNVNPWAIVVAAFSVLLLLMPRGLGNRWLGFFGLTVALLIPLKPLPALQMLVFDVGQGTAILLRTPHHQLLYDTGPSYTENFDAGSALIVPYLQSQNLRHLDRVVVSHNDLDHSGGLAGVLAATQVDSLLLGEPEKYHPALISSASSSPSLAALNFIASPTIFLCHQVEPWQWDEVSFRFITWPLVPSEKANNHSCVLQVEYKGQKILLTGDIEKEVERRLLAQNSLEHVDILLAPHHGSHTSSTQAFAEQTSPKMVIYSAGYRNQHGHPHRDIVARYTSLNVLSFNTAFSGALEFIWNNQSLKSVKEYRRFSPRYWFDEEGRE